MPWKKNPALSGFKVPLLLFNPLILVPAASWAELLGCWINARRAWLEAGWREGSALPLESGDPKSRELPAVLGTALPGGVANSKLGEGSKLWGFPFWGANSARGWWWGHLGTALWVPVVIHLLQLCPAGALDGRCAGEGIPGTSRLQLVIWRNTAAILLSSMANGNIPKWKCRNNLELKAAFVHSLTEKLPFSPDTLQALSKS